MLAYRPNHATGSGLSTPSREEASVTLRRCWLAPFVLCTSCSLVTCSNSSPQSPEPSHPEAHPRLGPAVHLRDLPRFSNCRLGGSSVDATSYQRTPPGGPPGPVSRKGRCSISADCSRDADAGTTSRGTVYLRCSEDDHCSCRLEPEAPPGPAVTFEFTATCASLEDMHRLMLERCLKGMQLAPVSPAKPALGSEG